MTLTELDSYFNGFLRKEDFINDPSKNGIQISNSSPSGKQIAKVAFAVDACAATALRAAEEGAELLFVHHGLFWGQCDTITGVHYERINIFLKNDLALYASHIPLDSNSSVGNNYGIAFRLGLTDLSPFGQWRGMTIGVKGALPNPLTVEELSQRALNKGEKPLYVLPFGVKKIRTVAIISGSAGEDHVQAANEGIDAYITGEIGHEVFHSAKELKLNLIAGGHYQTETVGINLVRQKLEKETGVKTVFIDFPTGL
ncbi:Nif3-like dinuclear metal center hexameric protein [Treponema parvum]|uniref:GTP cyclohydrolase 1 type 2 homolog n=1 Tax=Treponema parvum TaxID=138851 RepID=A0A975IDH9_9SPIR|nr:Nif3-like dinuclear metal center hexameric protein [Treponema parvum]QTQ13081.1 Nif3-like dinuclear metal center hexameric protein [Treponema parvum]